jgi:hypothetical protein
MFNPFFSGVYSFDVIFDGSGSHKMEVLLGSAAVTPSSWTFSFNGGDVMEINEANLDSLCAVPEFYILYTSV